MRERVERQSEQKF